MDVLTIPVNYYSCEISMYFTLTANNYALSTICRFLFFCSVMLQNKLLAGFPLLCKHKIPGYFQDFINKFQV